MRQYLAGKIRNVAIAGHGSSGKTSLAEALLFKAGATDRLGKVADGNTVCDFDVEEIRRKVSVSSAVAPFAWGSVKINLIDTPGLFDFAAGMYEGVRPAESVLIVVSARSGVTVGAQKAYKLADSMGKSKMFFVNKMDAEHADFYKVLEDLKASFGPSICPLVVPVVEDHKVQCYINLVDNKAYKYNEKGEPAEVAMPDIAHRFEGLIGAISEAVAETDEALFEKFFSGEQFTRDEIIKGIHNGVHTGAITPVLCGSAATLEGIDMLLDSLVDHLPSAWEAGSETAQDASGEPIEIACTDEAPLAAYIFKTVADPFVGKLSYFKVVSGKLSGEVAPVTSRTGEQERLGKLIYMTGKKQEDTAFITAGDIGAVTKLSGAVTGDTLCDPKKIVSFERVEFPEPCLSMAVKVQGKHKKQSGGHGQYGDVWIEFSPYDGEGLLFEENVFGGSVPKNFFPAVEKGLQDCVKHGILAGYPMVGLKAVLVDGSYHPVDSSEMAFKTAASLAYKAAMPQASPALLEPIGNLKVYVPDSNTGDIISELNKRRGRVLGMNPDEDGMQVIEGEVPMSEMGDFATVLRSTTQGRGSFTLKFERYELLPSQLEAAVIEEAKKMNEEEA